MAKRNMGVGVGGRDMEGLQGKWLSNGGRTKNGKAMDLYFNLKLKRKKFLEKISFLKLTFILNFNQKNVS